VRDSSIKFACKARNLFGEALFKSIDKGISNKEIVNKLNERDSNDSGLKPKNKEMSKGRKQGSDSKSKPNKYEEEQKSFIRTNQEIDITDEINKHLKKLNDSSNWQNRK
jgi:hypothetical protein